MRRLLIAIDPQLTERFGPEIHWTWRLLLTSIGWAWEEVPLDGSCDIAYVLEPTQAPAARLCIKANPDAWAQLGGYRLVNVGHQDGLTFPQFEGNPVVRDPVQLYDGRLICARDLVFDVFWTVTGQEERLWPKDRHGFHDLTGAAAFRTNVLRQALASQIGLWLERRMIELGCPLPRPRWPQGKQAAACVGHDVDYPEVVRWLEPLRVIARQGFGGIKAALEVLAGRRNHWQFSAWVLMEKQLGIRSAFYFVPRQGSLLEFVTGTPDPFYDITAQRFRQIFNFLTEEGFEVGLHASYLAFQSQEAFAAEKQRLEEASGQSVLGNRHHYWHLNPNDVEETLLIHEQIGLKYDTSLIHERYLGWRRGLSQPFFPFHRAERRGVKTLQIPTAWMDDQLFGHRADNPGDPWEILCALANRTAEHGGCLLVDIHDYVFDDTLFPGWRETYLRLWQYLVDRGDFWFGTPAQVAEHWIARCATLARVSHGLAEGAS